MKGILKAILLQEETLLKTNKQRQKNNYIFFLTNRFFPNPEFPLLVLFDSRGLDAIPERPWDGLGT